MGCYEIIVFRYITYAKFGFSFSTVSKTDYIF